MAPESNVAILQHLPPNVAQRAKPGRRTSLNQALDIQRDTYAGVRMLSKDLEETEDKLLRTRIAAGIAQLAKAWESMEDRKRILRGKPLPGSLRPERKAPRRKAQVHAITEAPEQDRSTITVSPKESLISPEAGPPPA